MPDDVLSPEATAPATTATEPLPAEPHAPAAVETTPAAEPAQPEASSAPPNPDIETQEEAVQAAAKGGMLPAGDVREMRRAGWPV